jgi:hypothetical protein
MGIYMSEFCTKCAEKESQMEIVIKNYYEEIKVLKDRIEKLESERDALILDVAFYGGNLINLSCDNK